MRSLACIVPHAGSLGVAFVLPCVGFGGASHMLRAAAWPQKVGELHPSSIPLASREQSCLREDVDSARATQDVVSDACFGLCWRCHSDAVCHSPSKFTSNKSRPFCQKRELKLSPRRINLLCERQEFAHPHSQGPTPHTLTSIFSTLAWFFSSLKLHATTCPRKFRSSDSLEKPGWEEKCFPL